MAVPLRHRSRTVRLRHQRLRIQHSGEGPEPHRAPHIALTTDDFLLRSHRRDHGIDAVRIKFGRGRPRQTSQILRRLDHHGLHAQAQPQGGDPVLPSPLECGNLPLDTPHPKASGNHHGVDPFKRLGCLPIIGAGVGRNPADTHARVVGKAPRTQRLYHRQVRVWQVDVLANDGDLDRVLRLGHPGEKLIPCRPIGLVQLKVQTLRHQRV